MPEITINMAVGRTDEQKAGMMRDISAALVTHLGVKPEDVTDIFITHMHWDHADGMDLFPKARIWLQKEEYVYYTGEAWQARNTHGGIDPDDVAALCASINYVVGALAN